MSTHGAQAIAQNIGSRPNLSYADRCIITSLPPRIPGRSSR